MWYKIKAMSNITTKKYSISYSIEDGIVILDNIKVESEYRGQGIGKKAMERFMKKFSGRDIELHAYAQDEQTDTIRLVEFYKKFGFEVVCGEESYGFEMKNY